MRAQEPVRETHGNIRERQDGKVLGEFPNSGIIEDVTLGLYAQRELNTGQLLSVVRALPGVRCAENLLSGRELGDAARLFRVTLDCAKLAALVQDPRIEFIERQAPRAVHPEASPTKSGRSGWRLRDR